VEGFGAGEILDVEDEDAEEGEATQHIECQDALRVADWRRGDALIFSLGRRDGLSCWVCFSQKGTIVSGKKSGPGWGPKEMNQRTDRLWLALTRQ
jgi:hypothetical protein